jgi:predicted DNA-binding protein with PD1-like motif
MKSSEGHPGRIFVIRLEHGDKIPHCIEQFAAEKGIFNGYVVLIGGVDKGEIVAGPRDSSTMPPNPVSIPFNAAHEILGLGLLAPDEEGKPALHMHASMGRGEKALTGCIRPGLFTWLVGEVIIYEICGTGAKRKADKQSGFVLLEID